MKFATLDMNFLTTNLFTDRELPTLGVDFIWHWIREPVHTIQCESVVQPRVGDKNVSSLVYFFSASRPERHRPAWWLCAQLSRWRSAIQPRLWVGRESKRWKSKGQSRQVLQLWTRGDGVPADQRQTRRPNVQSHEVRARTCSESVFGPPEPAPYLVESIVRLHLFSVCCVFVLLLVCWFVRSLAMLLVCSSFVYIYIYIYT